MVVTSAVIAAASVGTAAYGAYQASQTPGGPGANPTISKLPQDPVSKAMREYYARTVMENQGQQAPSFQSVIQSGGDMSTAKFPLIQPGLTPEEASGLGIVGKHGESIPYMPASQAEGSNVPGGAPSAGGGPPGSGASLDPSQTLYLARERARNAAAQGQQPGPWATKVLNTNQRLNQINQRLQNLQAIADPTQQQQNRIGRLQTKQQRVSGRQQQQLGGTPDPYYGEQR